MGVGRHALNKSLYRARRVPGAGRVVGIGKVHEPSVESVGQLGESLRPVIDILKAWGESHQDRLSCAPPPVVVKKPKRAAWRFTRRQR